MSTDLLPVWGATGTKIQPDPTKVSVGWLLGEKPPYEYMNWWQSIVTDRLNSILQTGPAPWAATTSYAVNALVSRGGIIYRATTANTNSAPPSANWLAVTQDAASIVQGTLNKARLPGVMNATIFEGATPQVRVSRTDNAANASVEYRTTAGSIFAGQGAAGVFSIGVSGVLSTQANVRFSVDTTGAISWSGVATGDGSKITGLNASNLAAGTVSKERISGDYEVRNLRVTGNLQLEGGIATEANKYIAQPGGTTPSFSFVGKEDSGLHMLAAMESVDLVYGGSTRLRINATQIAAANGAAFSGSGAGLSSVPAASLTGTLANARMSGDYSFANLTLTEGLTAATLTGRLLAGTGSLSNPGIGFSGQDGLGIRRVSGEMRAVVSGADIARFIGSGLRMMDGMSFQGSGSGLTDLDAASIATGTLADGRLPATMTPKEFNVSGALPSATFSRGSGVNIGVEFKGTAGSVVIGQGASGVFAVSSLIGGLSSSPAFTVNTGGGIGWSGAATGDGSGISKLDADKLASGTIPNARMSGAYSFASLSLTGDMSSATVTAGQLIVAAGTASAPGIRFAGADGAKVGIHRNGGSLVIDTDGSPSLTIGVSNIVAADGLVFGGSGANLTNLEASNIATGVLNAARLPATNAARDWVGSRIAAIPLGAIGSTAFLGRNTGQSITEGEVIDGAQLHYSSVFQGGGAADVQGLTSTSARPSGQWKAMGRCTNDENSPNNYAACNFVRVA